MTDSIVNEAIREVRPLSADDSVGLAVQRILEEDLPALPVVEEGGKFAGVFGEREFMEALFPGYMKELRSARMISRRMDEAIDRRVGCAVETIRSHLTAEAILVEDDYSDSQLAEIFLHHRVLIVPIATDGRVHAVVTRHDFFMALARRFAGRVEEAETER
jgi:CBS-domain-containing membrane protein